MILLASILSHKGRGSRVEGYFRSDDAKATRHPERSEGPNPAGGLCRHFCKEALVCTP